MNSINQHEALFNTIKTTHEAFLNNIDVKNSTAEALENGKIIIFPAIKSNPPPKQARKHLARKLTKLNERNLK